MAAVLIHIKSKMLLPRDPLARPKAGRSEKRTGQPAAGARKVQVRRADALQKQQIEDAVLTNPSLKDFIDAEGTEPEIAADVIDLVKTFQQMLERVRTRPVLNVDEETVTVGQMIEYLRRRLSLEDRPIRLKQLLMQSAIAAGAGLHVPGNAGTGTAPGDSGAAGEIIRRDRGPQAHAF